MKKLFYEATIKEVTTNQQFFDDFVNLIKYLNAKNVFECPDLMTFEWGKIKEWQYLFNTKEFDEKDLIRLFCDFTGKKESEISDTLAINFFYQIKWILEELQKLTMKEASNLSVQLTSKEIEAGFEDMNKFGYKATTDALAGGDVLKWDEVEREPYHKIFTKLLIQKVRAEIDKKYSEIMYKK